MSDAGIVAAIVVVLGGLLLVMQQGGLSLTGNLSAQQISQYAANAGFTGNSLVTAVAIALAESSGNPNAYNPETAAGAAVNQGSYGLWQIYLTAHPEYAGVNLYDPQTNANAAFAISGGSNFEPWSTYTSGAYQNQLAAAQGVSA